MADNYTEWDDAHFNPEELNVLDKLQGGAKYIGRGKNRRKYYPDLEDRLKNHGLDKEIKSSYEKHASGGSIGRLSKDAYEMRQKGRNGDTEMAHVGPYTRQVLDACMGGGSVNPRSGKKEYYGLKKFTRDVGRGFKKVGRFAGRTLKKVGRAASKGVHQIGGAAMGAMPGAIMGGMAGGPAGALAGGAASFMQNMQNTPMMQGMQGAQPMPNMFNMMPQQGGNMGLMSGLANFGQGQNIGQNVFGRAVDYGRNQMNQGMNQGRQLYDRGNQYAQNAQNQAQNAYDYSRDQGRHVVRQGKQQMGQMRDDLMNQGNNAYNQAQNYVSMAENNPYANYNYNYNQ